MKYTLPEPRYHTTTDCDSKLKYIPHYTADQMHAAYAAVGEVIDVLASAIAEAESAEPRCNPHPDAPHGFDRNGSHNAGRYKCDCEGWVPDDKPLNVREMIEGAWLAGYYHAGYTADSAYAIEQAEQCADECLGESQK